MVDREEIANYDRLMAAMETGVEKLAQQHDIKKGIRSGKRFSFGKSVQFPGMFLKPIQLSSYILQYNVFIRCDLMLKFKFLYIYSSLESSSLVDYYWI